MTKNIGKTDKIIRIVVGVALLVYAFISGNLIGLVGAVPIATAIIGWCPLYPILNISTCKKDS